MLKAGADGLIEAIALSIGGLKFTNDHLEFGNYFTVILNRRREKSLFYQKFMSICEGAYTVV
jgi:hypothetical protein